MVEEFHFGSIIKMQFDPHAGHEQAGWRPAIIISNDIYNGISNNLRMVCPITHTNRNSPFHIPITGCTKTDGYIMCDQARFLDIKARHAVLVEEAPELAADASTLVKEML